jgi:archaea-specific DNA-binding protein
MANESEQTNISGEGRMENIVYIGRKPTMNYVLAVVTQFNNGQKEVTIKARGNSISRAVDVKEIVMNRFLPELKEKSIKTSSEELTNEDGSSSKVSAIQIVLMR